MFIALVIDFGGTGSFSLNLSQVIYINGDEKGPSDDYLRGMLMLQGNHRLEFKVKPGKDPTLAQEEVDGLIGDIPAAIQAINAGVEQVFTRNWEHAKPVVA